VALESVWIFRFEMFAFFECGAQTGTLKEARAVVVD
jgi:hypothetical protein